MLTSARRNGGNVGLEFPPGLMAAGLVETPGCAACGLPSTHIELMTPGELLAEWEQWDGTRQGSFPLDRDPGRRHVIFKGVAAYNVRRWSLSPSAQ